MPTSSPTNGRRPAPDSLAERAQMERRRQVRGLLLLAAAAILFAIMRAGLNHVFTQGWWRLW
jgi:hypothetical protein